MGRGRGNSSARKGKRSTGGRTEDPRRNRRNDQAPTPAPDPVPAPVTAVAEPINAIAGPSSEIDLDFFEDFAGAGLTVVAEGDIAMNESTPSGETAI